MERHRERILYLGLRPEDKFYFVKPPEGVELVVLSEQGPILRSLDQVEEWREEGITTKEFIRRVFTGDIYECNDEKIRAIREITRSGTIDFVMISNALGVGVKKAPAVAEHLRRDKALVFWNNYTPGNEREYVEMGYRNFMSGTDVGEFFNQYLVLKYGNIERKLH